MTRLKRTNNGVYSAVFNMNNKEYRVYKTGKLLTRSIVKGRYMSNKLLKIFLNETIEDFTMEVNVVPRNKRTIFIK